MIPTRHLITQFYTFAHFSLHRLNLCSRSKTNRRSTPLCRTLTIFRLHDCLHLSQPNTHSNYTCHKSYHLTKPLLLCSLWPIKLLLAFLWSMMLLCWLIVLVMRCVVFLLWISLDESSFLMRVAECVIFLMSIASIATSFLIGESILLSFRVIAFSERLIR